MNQDQLFAYATGYLGQHLTLDPSVPAEVGCAEAVSKVLQLAGVPGIPERGFAGTHDLYQWLALNKHFTLLPHPEYGCVAIYPTSPKNPTKHGHVGIILKDGIASNNSHTGIFEKNFTPDSMEHYYHTIHGLCGYYFKPL